MSTWRRCRPARLSMKWSWSFCDCSASSCHVHAVPASLLLRYFAFVCISSVFVFNDNMVITRCIAAVSGESMLCVCLIVRVVLLGVVICKCLHWSSPGHEQWTRLLPTPAKDTSWLLENTLGIKRGIWNIPCPVFVHVGTHRHWQLTLNRTKPVASE